MKKYFVLYDGRAVEDTEDASIYDTANSEQEAIKTGKYSWHGSDGIWWMYDMDDEGVLHNEEPRYELAPCYNFKGLGWVLTIDVTMETVDVKFRTKYKWNNDPDDWDKPSYMLPEHEKVDRVLCMDSGQRRAYGDTYGTYHIFLKPDESMTEDDVWEFCQLYIEKSKRKRDEWWETQGSVRNDDGFWVYNTHSEYTD